MNIACVILNYNDSKNTIKIIDEIKNFECFSKIIVVDNCSTDDSLEQINSINSSKLIIVSAEKNGGYGYGNNKGVQIAKSLNCNFAVIANPDVYFEQQVILDMLKSFQLDSSLAVVSCMQKDRNDEFVLSAWPLPSCGQVIINQGLLFNCFRNTYKTEDLLRNDANYVGCVSGAMIMVDIEKFLEVGGYDERIFLYCEEITLGLRLFNRGYKTLLLTSSSYMHLHGLSINKTFKSNYSKIKLYIKSKNLLLNNYYKLKWYQILLNKLVDFYLVGEALLIALYKAIRY